MCGIFGYIGKKNALPIVISGLKKLEYRGYDSAGLAGVKDGKIIHFKEAGKVAVLEKESCKHPQDLDVAIAHTRWATHGKPDTRNAHPHLDEEQTLAIVHNGIIENYESLKKELKNDGVTFLSDTDTEVVAHLIGKYYEGDILKAVQKVVPMLKGSFAIAIVHKDYPNHIVAIANEMPLVIGVGNGEAFVSSDSQAILGHTRKVAFLQNYEIAMVSADTFSVFESNNQPVDKKLELLEGDFQEVSKGHFEHYTLKEIFEQPHTLRNAMLGRLDDEGGTAFFNEVDLDLHRFLDVERILILACGTSWHAGFVASYFIEEMAYIPVQVEISSEFRYKNPIVPRGTLAIAISQSGETADTLAAVRELKAKGARILAICNVLGSSLDREADTTILLRAGPEIGVCSTKAFTSQVTVLALLSLMLARMKTMTKREGHDFLTYIRKLPDQVKLILSQSTHIEKIAKKYAKYDNFFFLGRQHMYPGSLEGALKLKEISYINANGYPAGEMKHGPIALICDTCPTVALCCNQSTYPKMISNLMEVKSRNGPIIAIVEESMKGIEEIADDVIRIPDTLDQLAAIPVTIVTQLLAYYIARERGAEIDQPRNLAKSVTVE